jgi:hypothetical protein
MVQMDFVPEGIKEKLGGAPDRRVANIGPARCRSSMGYWCLR